MLCAQTQCQLVVAAVVVTVCATLTYASSDYEQLLHRVNLRANDLQLLPYPRIGKKAALMSRRSPLNTVARGYGKKGTGKIIREALMDIHDMTESKRSMRPVVSWIDEIERPGGDERDSDATGDELEFIEQTAGGGGAPNRANSGIVGFVGEDADDWLDSIAKSKRVRLQMPALSFGRFGRSRMARFGKRGKRIPMARFGR